MTVTTINPSDRTGTYEENNGTFVQWTDESNTIKLAFATAWNFTPSMDEWDIDRIDSAGPIFTKVNDILGTFSFNLKNAVSLYDTLAVPTNPILLSNWVADIANGQPPSITFAPVMKAVDATSNKFLNLIFIGRIMSVPLDQVLDQGVQDVVISGEITTINQIRRSASANLET